MAHIPAVCDNCGTFFPSGFTIENARNVTLSGNKSGPCPRCGGWGHVPDGIYNAIGTTLELVAGPERTIEELQRFAELLGRAGREGKSGQEVKEEIEREAPSMTPIGDLLAKFRELHPIIKVIGYIVTAAIAAKSSGINIHIGDVINHIYESEEIQQTHPQPNLEEIRDRTFTEEEVHIDGRLYVRCRFDRCTMVFSGTGVGLMKGCTLDRPNWKFDGAAGLTVEFLRWLYGDGEHEVIEQVLFNHIRGITPGARPGPSAGGSVDQPEP